MHCFCCQVISFLCFWSLGCWYLVIGFVFSSLWFLMSGQRFFVSGRWLLFSVHWLFVSGDLFFGFWSMVFGICILVFSISPLLFDAWFFLVFGVSGRWVRVSVGWFLASGPMFWVSCFCYFCILPLVWLT